jgi:hypothetical protein
MDRLCARCLRPADHEHHVIGRGMGGSTWLNYAEKKIDLCLSCHDWVHANPKAALEAGYRELRNVS